MAAAIRAFRDELIDALQRGPRPAVESGDEPADAPPRFAGERVRRGGAEMAAMRLHRLHQPRGRQRERQPQEPLERAVDAEARAGHHDDAGLPGEHRQRRGQRRVSSAHSDRPPCGTVTATRAVRACSAATSASRRGTQLGDRARRRSSSMLLDSDGGDELVEHRAAHVDRGPQRGQPMRRARCRARSQPMRSPPQIGLDSEPTVTHRAGRARPSRGSPAAEAEVDERLVHDDGRAGLPGRAQHARGGRRRHQRAGRVVEVRDQVGQPRLRLAQRGLQLADLPAAVRRPSAPGRCARRWPGSRRARRGRSAAR